MPIDSGGRPRPPAALAGCGHPAEDDMTKASSRLPPGSHELGPRRLERFARGCAPSRFACFASGSFDAAHLHHSPARRQAALRRPALGLDPWWSSGRRQLGEAVPRHLRPGQHRRRGWPAVDGVRARLPELGPLLHLLHGSPRLHPNRPVPPVGATPTAPTPVPRRLGDDRAPLPQQPQGWSAPVRPRRHALHRFRRRRIRRRPGRGTPRPARHPRQVDQDRPRAPAAATRSRPRNPSRAAPGARHEIYAYGLRNPYRFSFDRRTRSD